MTDYIIRWSLRNRAAIIVASIGLVIYGAYTALQMPIDVFPDLSAPTVTIIAEGHGMAPVDMEKLVTLPIESALNGAAGVRRVRSSTAVGLAIIWVEFDWGEDIYRARQLVNEKLSLVSGDLPPELPRPVLAPISSIMGEIMFIALGSDRHNALELRTAAQTQIRRRLLSVPGVAQVVAIGGAEKQYQVHLIPSRLLQYGLSLQDVLEALRHDNKNISAGFLNDSGSEYVVAGIGRYLSIEDIESTVITAIEGVPVQVRDVARVTIGEAVRRGSASADGHPAVLLSVQKQPGANTLELTRAIESVLKDIERGLPEGMHVDYGIFRQADFIQTAVNNVAEALRDGAVLVVIIVLVFLASLRSGLIALTAIPLSLVVAVLVLEAFGATINTMTLGGMAIALGAIVDDAIIDVENVVRRLRENTALPEGKRRPVIRVVYEASVEIRSSIVFATFIILLVFVPVFMLSGVEGRLLLPLGEAYVAALLSSLAVAVTLTPALCSLLLEKSRIVRRAQEPRLVRALKAAYQRILEPVLRHPWAVSIPLVLLFLLAAFVASQFGRSFLPDFNEGALNISAVTLPGTSLEESEKLVGMVEETLLSFPEIKAMGRRTGRAEEDEHAMGVESSEFEITLQATGRSKEEFLKALRAELAQIPGMNISIGQPISHRIDHMLSGNRASVAVKIFGDDLYRLRQLATQVKAAMEGVEGVVDLEAEQQADIPVLQVRFDRDALGAFGIHAGDAADALQAALQGVVVTRKLEAQTAFDVVVRLSDDSPWNRHNLEDMPLDSADGSTVPLGRVARISSITGPNAISREQVERKIAVTCNVAGRDVVSVVEDIRRRVDPIIAEQPGYRVLYGGQFESAEAAGRLLLIMGVAVVIAIGFLLHVVFGSARDAVFVMINLPLALIGGVLGVYLSGGVISVASMVGFITVFGIAARNGIMLVSHIRHLQLEEGVADFREAVLRGALERLAPILMTSLATALALVPLVLRGNEPGNEIQTPMAIVILGGLLSSMVLNMLVIPTLYLRFGRPAVLQSKGESV